MIIGTQHCFLETNAYRGEFAQRHLELFPVGLKASTISLDLLAMIISPCRGWRVDNLWGGWAFLSHSRVERCVCGYVATSDSVVDPSSDGPSPELTPGDGSPDGGSQLPALF
ncbi:hypothetical protein Hamer_G010939, partial [Homarus americanus]